MLKPILFIVFIIGSLSCRSNEYQQSETPISKKINTIKYTDSTLKTGWYFIILNENCYKRKLDKDSIYYCIDPRPLITPKNIKTIKINYEKNKAPSFLMKFDDEGTKIWKYATERAVYNKLAFILDDKLLYAPTVVSQIINGIALLNRGTYSKEELENFKKVIEREMN